MPLFSWHISIRWTDGKVGVASVTLAINHDDIWIIHQLANNTPPRVTGSAIALFVRMHSQRGWQTIMVGVTTTLCLVTRLYTTTHAIAQRRLSAASPPPRTAVVAKGVVWSLSKRGGGGGAAGGLSSRISPVQHLLNTCLPTLMIVDSDTTRYRVPSPDADAICRFAIDTVDPLGRFHDVIYEGCLGVQTPHELDSWRANQQHPHSAVANAIALIV